MNQPLGAPRRRRPDAVISCILSALVLYVFWGLITFGWFDPLLKNLPIGILLWAAFRPCWIFASFARNEVRLAELAMTGINPGTVFWSTIRRPLVLAYLPLVLFCGCGIIYEVRQRGFNIDVLFAAAYVAIPLAATADCVAYIAAAKSRAHWIVRALAWSCAAPLAAMAAVRSGDQLIAPASIVLSTVIITVRTRSAIRRLFEFR